MNPKHFRVVRRKVLRQIQAFLDRHTVILRPRRIIHLNLRPHRKPPMKTLLTNWKDILVFLAIAAFFAVLADVVTRLSVSGKDIPGLANLVGTLRGFSNFVGANLCAWLIGIGIGWPTLNRYSNDSFATGWASLDERGKFLTFVGVACLELIAAALCFSGA